MNLLQKMPIAFSEQVLKKLFLKMRWRRVLGKFDQILCADTLGMQEHDEVEQIDGVGCKLLHVDVGGHHLDWGWPERSFLRRQPERFGHSPVSDTVGQQMLFVTYSFH